MKTAWNTFRQWVTKMKWELFVLLLALKDPRIPWYSMAIALVTVAYALSPIDLILDFIPILGYLDDIIIVPIGIWLCSKTVPKKILDECRLRTIALEEAQKQRELYTSQLRWYGLAIIITIWAMMLIFAALWL